MVLKLRKMLDSTILHLVCCKQESRRKKLQGIANSVTKKEEKAADEKKLGANNWNDTTDATATVPVDTKKPMCAHLKFKERCLNRGCWVE